MAKQRISEMTTSEFRAYVKTLTPKQAERARQERRLFTKARWGEAHPERVRESGRRRWSVWFASLNETEREELRARERERKRRERTKN